MKKVVWLLLFIPLATAAQTGKLRQKIQQVVTSHKADIGVSIVGIESKDTLTINDQKHYPLQSVFKFHIALATLHLVDKDQLDLTQNVLIKRKELLTNTWSPLRDDHPTGDVILPLGDIIKYMVSQSDNNACDILLRRIGGTAVVDKFVRDKGITDFAIKVNEEEMHQEWNVQFFNWSTPSAATDLLLLCYNQQLLSKNSYDFLWKLMIETSTGKGRMKALLPKDAIVAHKTGTSDTNEQGVTAAINDIGIVTLPNGKHFAISVFVSNSKEPVADMEKAIADITKLAWDHFNTK